MGNNVEITSLSVEISAESKGAEINVKKLANALSELKNQSDLSGVCKSLDNLSKSLDGLKNSSKGITGLTKLTKNLSALSSVKSLSDVSTVIRDFSAAMKSLNISNQAKELGMLSRSLLKIPAAVSKLHSVDYYGLSGDITQLVNALAPLSILDVSGLKALGSAMTSLGKVPDVAKNLKGVDLDSFDVSCKKIAQSLVPLSAQLEKVGTAFSKMPAYMTKLVSASNKVVAANNKAKTSFAGYTGVIGKFLKQFSIVAVISKLGQYAADATTAFNDFYEATDLFHKSLGELTEEFTPLINKMQTFLGIDPKNAMEHVAVIQSLTTSFGIASDKAAVLSKNLTQLAYDESSYWNKSDADTFTAIQSAISGELEPIRRLGVDLSQARLQQELLELGFNRQISTLSQADKAILRYIAIMKQTANIQGNLGATIESPANQVRILKSQLDQLAKSVGSLLYPALKSILPPLIAAVELAKELVSWLGSLMGIEIKFTDFSAQQDSIGGVADAMGDVTDATNKASKALKSYTMGFDELNIIEPQSSTAGAGSAGTNNILGDVDLSQYDIFKDYMSGLKENIESIKSKIKGLIPLVSGVAAGFATWKIGNFLFDNLDSIIEKLKNLTKEGGLISRTLKLWKSPVMGASVAVGIMVSRFIDLYNKSEDFRKGIDRIKALIELTVQGFKDGFNFSLTEGKLGESIEKFKQSVANLEEKIWELIPDGWKETITSVFDEISRIVKDLDLDVGDLLVTLAAIGLTVSGHPVAGLAVAGFEMITLAIRKFGDESEKEAIEIKSNWYSAFQGFGETIGNFVSIAVDGIATLINDIAIFIGWITNGISETERLDIQMNGNFLENTVMGLAQIIHDIGVFVGWITDGVSETDRLDIQMNGNFLEKAVLGFADLINFIKDAFNWITSLGNPLDTAGQKVNELVSAAKEWLAKVSEIVSKFINDAISGIESLPGKMAEAGKNIVRGLVNGINNGIEWGKNAVGNLAKSIIDKFTTDTEIHSPSKLFERFGNFIGEGLANGINNSTPMVGVAMQSLADTVATKGQGIIDKGYEASTGFVSNFISGLDNTWNEINNSLQTNFTGSLSALSDAIENGDLQSLGKWSASLFWHAMDDEQRKQIKSIAEHSLSWLKDGLSRVWMNISGLAGSYVGTLVPATGAAATAQGTLNTVMSANPILFIISLIAMLAGALINFAGVNSDVGSSVSGVWAGIGDFMSLIFEGIIRLIGLFVQNFVNMINGLIASYNAVAWLWGGKIDYVKNPVFEYADKIAEDRKKRQEERKKEQERLQKEKEELENLKNQIQSPGGPNISRPDFSSPDGSGSGSSHPSISTPNVNVNIDSLRDAVYNGTYKAFIDIYQRYQGDDKDNIIKIYLDGKQLTASVEKRKNERGMGLMGNEAYSY